MICKCKKCGGPALTGHEICWFCEHDPKLHTEELEENCEEDKNGTEQRP